MELTVQIIGENLEQVRFGEAGKPETEEDRSRLFLGIQKGQDVVDTVPVTAPEATFTARFEVAELPEGGTNFLGPYAHGKRTERFCYLCWLSEERDGSRRTFSRIKLHLTFLPWERVAAAAIAGTPLVLRFSLVGKGGKPVCASVRQDDIQWED